MFPTVSVIMPAFNGEKYIAPAIRSALSQLHDRDEIVVVDNASTDATAHIVRDIEDPRIRYFYEPKKGAAAARNHAFRQMSGDLVAFLDCDDLWPEGRQKLLLDALEDHQESNAVYGRIRFIFGARPEDRMRRIDGMLTPLFSLSSFLFRRSLLEKCGEMDETLLTAEDTDYLVRLRDAGMRAMAIDCDAFIYRRHDSNTTSEQAFNSNILLQVLSRKINRERRPSP